MTDWRTTYNSQFSQHVPAQNLISKIDTTVDRDENIAILLSTGTQKKGLKAIVTYLKDNFTETFPKATDELNTKLHNINKADLINQILDFVIFTLPTSCLKCEDKYIPYNQTDSAEDDVRCFVCKLPAHKKCYKTEDIKFHLVFLCESCMKGEKRKNTVDNKVTKLVNTTVVVGTTSSEEDSSTDDTTEEEDTENAMWTTKKKKERKRSQHSQHEELKVEKKKEKSKAICKLYKAGVCPFGRSGRECSKQHPPHCRRWCGYGQSKMGCKWGDECWFFHPDICEHSEKLKKCLNLECPKIHLKGTQRYILRVEEEDFNQYPRSRNFVSNRRQNDEEEDLNQYPRSRNFVSNRRQNEQFQSNTTDYRGNSYNSKDIYRANYNTQNNTRDERKNNSGNYQDRQNMSQHEVPSSNEPRITEAQLRKETRPF